MAARSQVVTSDSSNLRNGMMKKHERACQAQPQQVLGTNTRRLLPLHSAQTQQCGIYLVLNSSSSVTARNGTSRMVPAMKSQPLGRMGWKNAQKPLLCKQQECAATSSDDVIANGAWSSSASSPKRKQRYSMQTPFCAAAVHSATSCARLCQTTTATEAISAHRSRQTHQNGTCA